MKLGMAIGSVVGEEEIHRQQACHAQAHRAAAARSWAQIQEGCGGMTRKAIKLIFWTAIIVTAIAYRSEIADFIGPKAKALISSVGKIGSGNSLRQQTINNENAVAEVMK